MQPQAGYLETVVTFDRPLPDFYAVWLKARSIVSAYPGTSYSPLGAHGQFHGILLRGFPTSRLPGSSPEFKPLAPHQPVMIRGGFSLPGVDPDSEPFIQNPDIALSTWLSTLSFLGFSAPTSEPDIERNSAYFYDAEARSDSSLPLWSISASFTVDLPDMAASAMVRGLGQHRQMGLGMLLTDSSR